MVLTDSSENQNAALKEQRKFLMKGLQFPSGIVFEPEEKDSFYGKASVYPFERGYGTTIANALRRTLISSISGFAFTAIKIRYQDENGDVHVVSNLFEPIPGVYDDTVVIVSNLRKLNIQLNNDEHIDMVEISLEGEQRVTGSALNIGAVTVLNPEHYLFTTMVDAKLDITLQVEFGRGYVPADSKRATEELGAIALDAIFTPIEKVKYAVSNVRVGVRNDYERIELEIWTNGTVSPSTALGEAAKFLKDSLAIFINFSEEQVESTIPSKLESLQSKKLLDATVDDLELSARSSNCLRSISVNTVEDLTKKKESEIAAIKNFGKKSLDEIKEKMKAYNLTFRPEDSQT